MGNEAKQNKHVKAKPKQNQKKKGFWASSCTCMNKPPCT